MNSLKTEIINNSHRQKYLKDKRLIVFIAFLSAFIPMSTDLYLPALLKMAQHFNSSPNLINLTLILFFIFYAVCTLIWGPLSDKYGRKPVLQIGLVIYAAGAVICALSGNVYSLIAFRVIQAIGGSGVTASASSIVKDIWSGRKRETVLASVQTMVIISPVIAPSIGSLLLRFTSWRGIFWTMSSLGILALVVSFLLEDTILVRYTGTLLQTIGRLKVVLQNPGFSSLLAIFSLPGIPILAFIASSSYIYINDFKLNEEHYSFYFAINGLCSMAGPVIYLLLSGRFKRSSIITSSFFIIAVSGCLISIFGKVSPLVFALCVIPSTMTGSALRPPGTNLMLEQQLHDTGSASSLMSCFGILAGSLGMAIVSYEAAHIITVLGILNITIGLLGAILWLIVSGKSFVKTIPEAIKSA